MSGSYGAIIGAPNLRLINSITQFFNGTQAIWNDITVPIPLGLVVYATDTTAVKIGDGVQLYIDLPVWFTLNSLLSVGQQVAQLFADLALLAPKHSPTFTGLPKAPTPAPADNSDQLATTAYTDRAIAAVALQAAAGITPSDLQAFLTAALTAAAATHAPLMDGTAAVGAAGLFAREDHVHPSDTSRAAANAVRNRLTADGTFYISSIAGNDTTGDGSSQRPWATVPRADAVITSQYDLAGYSATYRYNGTTLVRFVDLPVGINYTWDVSTPPSQDIRLTVGERATITFTSTTAIPLCIATEPGVYKITLIVTGSSTVNTDWMLRPNNATYAGSIMTWHLANTDWVPIAFGNANANITFAALNVFPYAALAPRTDTALTGEFFFDLFIGPHPSDTINAIGPSILEITVSTYTRGKMARSVGGVAGGGSISFGSWSDTTTPWTSLGTLYDKGGNALQNVNATVSGTAIIERLA